MTEPDTTDAAPRPEAGDQAPPAHPDARPPAGSRRAATVTVVRWGGWLLPLALYAWFYDLRWLDITRAFPLLRGDWALYIAAPNFVRDAPWLSFPIGRLPEYMAPVGTWLGQTDSWPALYPVYRALAIAMPHRPFQLIGWQLLGSFAATFGIVRWYLRSEVRAVWDDALRAELAATAGAVALVAQPFYLLRAGHPALFQMWVVPWALIVVARLLEQRRGRAVTVSTVAFVAPLAAATALNPYLAVMLLPVMCIPVVATARAHVRESAVLLAGSLAVFVVVSYALGYVGTGGRSQSDGFGLYMADAGLLFDAGALSRTWPNVPPDLTYEGNGFMGTALVVLALGVGVALIVGRVRSRGSTHGAWLWPLWLGVGASLVWAMLPVIRLFDHTVLDLNGELEPIHDLLATVRSNGRLAWPFVWMIGLFSVRYLIRRRHTAAHLAIGAIAVFQVADAVRPHIPEVPDRYGPAMAIVREARATGITRIEFQPPNVWTDCPAHEWGPFEHIAPLAVAAGVERLAINSGYPSRGDDAFRDEICTAQREDYLAGNLAGDVLYVIPAGVEPVSPDLECRLTELDATVCRLPAEPGGADGAP